MAPLSDLPVRLQKLTSEIKAKEQELKRLRRAERKTYKSYTRARAKLASKNHGDLQNPKTRKWYSVWIKSADDLQNPKTRKWYSVWIKSADDLQALANQLEREESRLASLKQQRAEGVAQDRTVFERDLLAS